MMKTHKSLLDEAVSEESQAAAISTWLRPFRHFLTGAYQCKVVCGLMPI